MAAITAALSTLHLSKPSSITRTHRLVRTFITASSVSSSSSSSTREFKVKFDPRKPVTAKPAPNSKPESESPEEPLYIPWAVRDEKGNIALQTIASTSLLHAIANDKTSLVKKKPKKKDVSSGKALTSEPKYSKAARRFYNQNFKDPPQRLSKVLAAAGVASRRRSEELIFEGRVTVNGSVCNTPQTKVDPGKDSIYVNGSRLPKKLPPKVYLALNKPKGYICSSGEKETKPIISLFDDYLKTWDKKNSEPKPRLFTVGRLDVATSGLIIVTNDGEFAQKISHPSANLSKEYIAAVDGVVNKKHLIAISEGTLIDGVHCTPDAVELLPRQTGISKTRLRIVVHEGRNHEVRELVNHAGLKIHSLKRVRIGAFRLPQDLGLGQHMVLKQSHLRALGWDV